MGEERGKGYDDRNVDKINDNEKWVCDSSLDYKGNLPLRASTGVWKASFFIIAIEFSERLSYFGIATSLMIYLTKVIHQDLETAAKSVNYWSGVTTLMPLIGGFLADAYFGRFFTVFISSIIYILGLVLLTMSRLIPSFRPCDTDPCSNTRTIHEVFFFLSIYMISIGTGGHKPALESFGADQFDDDHDGERGKKMSFFNWWNFGLCSGLLLGVTLIVYVQDHVGWGAADVILMIIMTISLGIFIVGRPYYRFRKPSGSFVKPMLQVLVAAFEKRRVPYPSSSVELYEAPMEQHSRRRLCHTETLKFLDKAAIIANKEVSAEKVSPWKLATVTQVEETKLIMNMIPIWLACVPFVVCTSQTTTFFIKQATVMNRNIGNNFIIPPASIFALSAIGMIITVIVYDKILVPIVRRVRHDERGIKILQRIGLGMIFTFASLVIAALVERKRLKTVSDDPQRGSLSMSAFWLAPQFVIIGVADGFTLVGLQEYFYDQVPDSMRSLGIGLYLSVIGAANFMSSLLITTIGRVTAKAGNNWFGKDLNTSHLDYFYWLLASLSMVNLFVYVLLARRYKYKSVEKRSNVRVDDCYDHDKLDFI
ncbi:hypothetical protein RND81_10G194900 [Saponaria officinalis]|uniref:Uncharacterized protein n=1 Tax=Saponaria officinalis TaxID=3572 RepID=A0AAW1I3Z2_SAPOF